MKTKDILIGILIGVVAAHLWNMQKRKKNNPGSNILVKDVIDEEAIKYSNPLSQKYDIVMPSDIVSKKLKQRADKITADRYKYDKNKIKNPVSI